jgi:hypothetical protein
MTTQPFELPDFESRIAEAAQEAAERSGDVKLELAYLGRGDGTAIQRNPDRIFDRQFFHHAKDGPRVAGIGSAVLDPDTSIFYEDSTDNMDLPVLIMTRRGERRIVGLQLPLALDENGNTPLERRIKAAQDGQYIQLPNAGAGTANAGDVGYITYDNTQGLIYLPTTAADLDGVPWCVVTEGGAASASIRVAQRGEFTLNWAGTAPTAKQFLSTSTTSGRCKARSLFHAGVMAVAIEDGVADPGGTTGTVRAILMTRSQRFGAYNASGPINVAGPVSDTLWTGTINGAPSATSVVLTTATGALVNWALSSTDLLKVRLRNTTRNTYRVVTSLNVGTATATTVSTSDAWANLDNVTIESATCVSGLGNKFVDLDLTQFTVLPRTARSLILMVFFRDTAAAGQGFGFLHPFTTYNSLTQHGIASIPGNFGTSVQVEVPLYDEALCYSIDATGATTASLFSRYNGFTLAVP